MSDDEDDLLFDWHTVTTAVGERRRCGGRRDRSPTVALLPRAQMIPFPLARRRDFVSGLAGQVASRTAAAGDLHLLQQLDRQRDVLARKGIPKAAIERELSSLSSAVRAELWRLLLGSGA